MNILHAIVLGLVQGLTEFLPVSSSGHLLLVHHAFGITHQSLGFDVALHAGTLAALLVFFYADIWELLKDAITKGPKSRLAWIIVFATVPAAVAGFLLRDLAETTLRSPLLVALTLGSVGILMLLAERFARRSKQTDLEDMSGWQGIIVGVAQAVALIPGVSRSGSTITAGLFAGLDRVTATRFSFLLSIPITFGAILRMAVDGSTLSQVREDGVLFGVGIVAAFVSGIVAIRFLLRFVAGHGLHVFAYYRLLLSGVVLASLTV